MERISFYKFHGTGNDFILIDNRSGNFLPDASLIGRLCHRRYGIGADGLILIQHHPSLDFEMIYYNSDGMEGTMCGNGGRCAIAFSDFLSAARSKVNFMAVDGEHKGWISRRKGHEWHVKLWMSDVAPPVPVAGGHFVDTGSPHLVKLVENVEDVDVVTEGRKLRHDALFAPGGTNVDFVQSVPGGLAVRSYERGVEDETLSCGTGVTAAAIFMADKFGRGSGRADIMTRGGNLAVHWSRSGEMFREIILEGPAVMAFSGEITI